MNSTELELHVQDLIKKAIMEEKNHRSKNLHVTGITQKCQRRTYYDITRDQPKKDFETAALLKIGTMVHAGIVLNPMGNEIHMAADIRKMEPIEVKDINPLNYLSCVSGSMDHLINYKGEDVIIDLKTFSMVTKKSLEKYLKGESKILSAYLPTEENENYITQVNIYKLLYWINFKKEIKRSCIAHIDTASRMSIIRVFEIQLDPLDKIQKMVLDKLDQLKNGNLPPRVITWLCDYCPWNTKEVCNPESDSNYLIDIKKR